MQHQQIRRHQGAALRGHVDVEVRIELQQIMDLHMVQIADSLQHGPVDARARQVQVGEQDQDARLVGHGDAPGWSAGDCTGVRRSVRDEQVATARGQASRRQTAWLARGAPACWVFSADPASGWWAPGFPVGPRRGASPWPQTLGMPWLAGAGSIGPVMTGSAPARAPDHAASPPGRLTVERLSRLRRPATMWPPGVKVIARVRAIMPSQDPPQPTNAGTTKFVATHAIRRSGTAPGSRGPGTRD